MSQKGRLMFFERCTKWQNHKPAAVSFEDAVAVFRERGFTVEPGPGENEVSIMVNNSSGQGYCVITAEMLRNMAQEILLHRESGVH